MDNFEGDSQMMSHIAGVGKIVRETLICCFTYLNGETNGALDSFHEQKQLRC